MSIIERADAIQEGVTRGPWKIESWAEGRIFSIVGRGGDPEFYEYDTEVMEAEHYGECGCRSSCELSKRFVIESRTLIPELNQTLKDVLEAVRVSAACGTSPELTLEYVQEIINR